METFLQLLTSGIATGATYALVAVGFALLWQTAGAINFAQGEFLMLAGFIILLITKFLGVSVILAFLIALPIILLLMGYGFKRLLVDPLLKYGEFTLVIATIGLGILLKEAAKTFVSAEPLPFPLVVSEEIYRFGGVAISLKDITTFAIAFAIILALQFFLNRTFVGRSMEATAQNREVARILGIDVERMILYTFLLNAALVAVAALLITPTHFAKFDNGEVFGLIAFMSAIVGGFNQVRGALIGGFLLGILDNLSAFYISAQYRNAFPILLLILVILFKPEGLFGRREERRI